MIVERDLIHTLKPFLKRKEFISIIGPRQCGKTIFLEIIKKHLIEVDKVRPEFIQSVTFEDRRFLMEFERDALGFVRSFIPQDKQQKFYLMIDEFQYAEEGDQKLKFIYDTLKGIKVIITGSSSLDIKAKVGKFMVGRMLHFHLYPFSFQELLRAHSPRLEKIYSQRHKQVIDFVLQGKVSQFKKGQDNFFHELLPLYEDFAIWGGYPAVALAKTQVERKKLISDVYNNYILKDVKTLLELATEKNLFLLSQYLATQIGNLVVFQNLSQACGLQHRQLKKHLNILEETFISKALKPFFTNRQKELSKNPKIYFMDMGFRNNLMENMHGLEKRSDAGAIVENTAFIQLQESLGDMHKLNFWRTKAGAEVDFILHIEGKVVPIEIKYSSFEAAKVSKGLLSFIDTFKPSGTCVFTKNYWGEAKRKHTRISFIPIYYL